MTIAIANIAKILDLHYINYNIDNNRIIAEEVYTKDGKLYIDKIDITNYTKRELYNWLGY